MTPATPRPMVSVVIPCRDASSTLGDQLAALGRQTYPHTFEVIVADNGSTDGSAEIARSSGASVVDASDRRGVNHARNVGAFHAAGARILLCDADDIVAEDWVAHMVSALDVFDLVGGMMDRDALNPDVPSRWLRGTRYDTPRFEFLPAAPGANFGIRRDVLYALGGWDESFESGPDDIELCWRAQLAGYSLGHVRSAVVHYRMRSTTIGLARQVYRRATYMPLLFRRFDLRDLPRRSGLTKAIRYGMFLALGWPLALVSGQWRREWVRRLALVAGVARGLFRKAVPPAYGLAAVGPDRA